MVFNSNDFAIFFALFLALYWAVRRWMAARNVLIVVASYVFYCWWDFRFGALLLFTSLADFTFGRLIERASPPARKALLTASVGISLGILGYFKYSGFFAASLQEFLAQVFHIQARWQTLSVVLPIGISFYTFQSMSYVIDVYRGQLPAARNLIQFLAYVSFFPQLVAGPIERAAHLLPQFARTRHVTAENLEHGLWLVLWGLFEKVVLADNLAPLADLAIDRAQPSLPVLALGATAFGLQIYCDFAGYSDIARGLAKLLGFDLMLNFNLPYLARSVREFWQRWHISLSTWIRDYLYIPLGGNRRGEFRACLNLLVAMLLAGLWHGAAANFVLWGAWHGFGLVVNRVWNRLRSPRIILPGSLAWALTAIFVWAGWLLFRAHSVQQIIGFVAAAGRFTVPIWWATYLKSLAVLTAPVAAMHFLQARRNQSESFLLFRRPARALLQGLFLLAIIAWWKREESTFIYFQF